MDKVFKERRSRFTTQSMKYLRYVLNDHFILVLLFLLGFLLVQYSQLLRHFPSQHLVVWLVLVVVMVILLFLGRIATYLEPADQQFLLAKELAVAEQINQASRRAYVIWTTLQTLLLVFLSPVFLKLGLSVVGLMTLLLVMAGLKGLVFAHKKRQLFSGQQVKWEEAISYERKRQQSILAFFALFTTVKGISTSVKRRAYLDGMAKVFGKSRLWHHLYLRAFLRSGDYLGLTLRLFVLAVLMLVLVPNGLLGTGLALLLDYLLLFQLLGLGKHFDYQYLLQVYPQKNEDKKADLHSLLRLIAYSMLVVEMLVSWQWVSAGILAGVMLILVEIYLPFKLRKMFD